MPDFLGHVACAALVAEIKVMWDDDTLQAAGVGRGMERQVQTDIRSDSIHWMDESSSTGPQRIARERLEVLRVALNRRLFLGLTDLEAHLSAYSPGGAYQKHVDAFRDSNRRFVSCVVYLNPDWHTEHGGELRLYERTDSKRVASDVAPHSGTLACFLSADIAHEVLVTTRERFSITGWFSRNSASATR